jgi:hypothetical protein
MPMPSAPAGAVWEISLAAYLRQRTDLPSLALKPLGLLDRYGEVAVGPDHMAFDGEDVPWDKAVRVIVRDLVEVVSDKAMAREADKIRHMLPPVPGRKWVVDHAMALLGDFAAPRLTRTRGGDVVSEVVYRGAFGREKTVQAGVFAALVMATWPDVRQSLVATARLHGVEVYGESATQEALPPAPAGYQALPQHNAADAPTLMIPPQQAAPAAADAPTVIIPPQPSAADAPTLMIPPQPSPAGAPPAVAAPRQDLWTPAEPAPEG